MPLGRVLDAGGFSNEPRGHRAVLRWVRERGPDRVIGIECSLSYGASLSRFLLDAGEDVREVPTTLPHQERRRRHSQGKSDIVDAVAVARIVASGEVLPSARRVEALADLRALVDYRDQLVRARTQVANRAHADLVNIRPGYQREIPNLRAQVHRAKARSLVRGDRSVRAELIRRRLGELSRLEGKITALSGSGGAAGQTVTFLDSKGAVIGTAALGPNVVVDQPGECVATNTYGATFPKEDFYQARVPGRFNPVSKPYADLSANGFRWDFP
jgi:transposase